MCPNKNRQTCVKKLRVFFFDELLGSSAIVGNPKSGVDQHWDQLVLSMGKESFNTQKSAVIGG